MLHHVIMSRALVLDSHRVATSTSYCLHCGDKVPLARTEFCCDGCSSVYKLLNELKLGKEYYELRGEKRSAIKPILETNEDFSILDEKPFRTSDTLDFFIEGIHCTACVWILEKLPELTREVQWSRLDLGRSILKVKVFPHGKFETVAKLMLKLGYRAHAVLSDAEADSRLVRQDKQTLRRLGVAAFSAMNVMIYSISLYTGVDGDYAVLFRILSILVALPALTYSAWPFYLSSWNAIKNKRISIDLPISLAFLGGFFESVRQAYLGTNHIYLDSVTSLVFLMLLSRYVLSRLERSELSKSGLLQALLPNKVKRMRNGEMEFVRTSQLKPGDLIEMNTLSRIPADGLVLAGEGLVSNSPLTGESKLLTVKKGDSVFAGSEFAEGKITVRVKQCGYDTRLGAIQSQLEEVVPPKNKRVDRSDRWAQIFLLVVIGLAAVLLVAFGKENAAEAFKRSLALIIIACPCALALATPLTLTRAFRKGVNEGILLRDTDAIERLMDVKKVVFDKTGTLTRGKPVITNWQWLEDFSPAEKNLLQSIAYTLESNAKHPIGKAIVRFLENKPGVRLVLDLRVVEIAGQGVSAEWNGDDYSISRNEFKKNASVIARFTAHDELREESLKVMSQLKKMGYELYLFTGDEETIARSVAQNLGISHVKFCLSPEDKKRELKALGEGTLAIGDGINDALILKEATVGVAFNRGDGTSIEPTLSHASVAIVRPNLNALLDLFILSKKYDQTLKRNAVFSVFYNLVGATFAVMGIVHPAVAAIAMPVSAFTVFISTFLGLSERKPKEVAV